jgi:DNA-binding response OmpR family regulator
MKDRHIALIVEDDREIAEELREILAAIDCKSVIADNSEHAMRKLRNGSYCLILLDLHIKSAPDSIKGHEEHGKALLRKIRQKHGHHNGIPFWLPVIIVSGYAREVDEAVNVMRDGASDIIRKPFTGRQVSEKVRLAFQASGRHTHERCHEPPTEGPDVHDGVVIAVPGDRSRRRTRVTIASKQVYLPDASLKLLLHLIIAKQKGKSVHKIDLGGQKAAYQGFKGIPNLRNELKQVLGSLNIIHNDYHGNYSFEDNVTVGECAVEKLLQINDETISRLAKQIQSPRRRTRTKKV